VLSNVSDGTAGTPPGLGGASSHTAGLPLPSGRLKSSSTAERPLGHCGPRLPSDPTIPHFAGWARLAPARASTTMMNPKLLGKSKIGVPSGSVPDGEMR
jgi:hypothetical protein